jgi:addiction module HigA family antidote
LKIITKENPMPMKMPSHPGEVFYWGVLEPLEVSVSEAARVLGVRRATLSAVVNARAALSPDLAMRIEKAFGPKVDLMLRIQAAYDAAEVRKREKAIKVKRYIARAA